MVWDQDTFVLNKHLDSDAGGPLRSKGLWVCLEKKRLILIVTLWPVITSRWHLTESFDAG